MIRSCIFFVFVLFFSYTYGGYDWVKYKETYNKNYETPEEEMIRRYLWSRNRLNIAIFNTFAPAVGIHHRLKQTYFTDQSRRELGTFARTEPPDDLITRAASIRPFTTNRPVPDAVDWRNSPCLPPIEFQGSCGCCWAFAASTPIAFQQCVKNNNSIPIVLSNQQLVDCSSDPSPFGNKGCFGGWYEKAWQYLIRGTDGHVPASQYPYIASIGPCQYSNSSNVMSPVAKIKGFTATGLNNETSLKLAVAVMGPVSASLCGTCPSFTNYASGIYEDPTCNCSVNHGVTIVGYGTSFGTDYWIVRNSWGKSWGLAGYALVRRGINQSNLAYWPSFPIIA